jgi:hypothetical protein
VNAVRVTALAGLTVRSAVRSRLLLSLTTLVLLGVVVLPLAIRGDGTPAGRLCVVLRYTLGCTTGLLSLTTLWAGSMAVASEVADGRLRLVMAKPVRRHEVWLGKWAGLILMDALIVAAAGTGILGMIRWTARPAALGAGEQRLVAEQILTARLAVAPGLGDLEQRLAGEPAGAPPPRGAETAARTARIYREAHTVAPGQSTRWVFRLPRVRDSDRPLGLQYRFVSSDPRRPPARGTWQVGRPGSPALFGASVTNVPGITAELVLPAGVAAGTDLLSVEFTNASDDPPATLIFEREDGVELLVPAGGFVGNYVKALGIILVRLALLAALGLTAGCLLSGPVAAFASTAALVVLAVGPYVGTVAATGVFYVPHEGPLPAPGPLDPLLHGVFRAADAVVGPLRALDPVPALSEGRWIPWAEAGRATAVVALYAACLAAAGIGLFRRREIGAAG